MADYDVAVVGAGPGGAYAAWKLAEGGLSVFCVDKREEIGSPVRCAEGLQDMAIKELGIPHSDKYVAQDICGYSVISPDGTRVLLKDRNIDFMRGYVLERKIFDKYLAILAARAGAKVRARTRCTGLLRDGKTVTGIKVESMGESWDVPAGLTVAADGVDSKVARWAGINTTSRLDAVEAGFQYELAGIDIEDPEVLEFYFGQKVAPEGYIWVFPKGKDVANVGIGIKGSAEKNAKLYLDRWLKDQPNYGDASFVEVNAGGIPVSGGLDRFVTDGLAVVGDAAHQVSPITGGGIGLAMNAGKMLAEVAEKCLKKKDFSRRALAEYEKKWKKENAKAMSRHLKIQKVLVKMSDEELNRLAKVLDGKTILDVMEGKITTVGKTLFKPEVRKLVMSIIRA